MTKDQKQYQTAIDSLQAGIDKLKRTGTKTMQYDDVTDSGYIIDAYEKIIEGLEVLRDVCVPFEIVEYRLKGNKP